MIAAAMLALVFGSGVRSEAMGKRIRPAIVAWRNGPSEPIEAQTVEWKEMYFPPSAPAHDSEPRKPAGSSSKAGHPRAFWLPDLLLKRGRLQAFRRLKATH